ncbi:hypothetical protein FNV43_RR08145 [Rhamnella rubrinervis]|uniref:Uncharacterized protein n=1 Tax=Rhamnella rubrinervis TaxID=2594499 RepID=A0A8K0HH32_9ROSA|nr:hypothetical protein FNV43_RR08145 [Rhamnella rubrinervis]
MGRSPCCSKEGLNRGAWTAMEDKILTDYITTHGEGKWRNLPKRAGLKRCGKSCRLRWLNYLRPDIKRGNITGDEEELIIRLHNLLGNRWSLIAGRLPGRTDNEIKNYWNTNIGKKIQGGGHQPSSTTSCKQIILSSHNDREKLPYYNPTKGHSKASHPSTHKAAINSSRVVRTKASRCTKVVIPAAQHPQKLNHQLDHHGHVDDTTKPALVHEPSVDVDNHDRDDQVKDDQAVGLQVPLLPLISSDDNYNNSSEFMMDLELDESLLSDLPNFDFLHFTYFGNGGGDDDHIDGNNFDHNNVSTTYNEKAQLSSPKSDDLAAEDMMYGVDLGSMAALVDPEVLDWIRD